MINLHYLVLLAMGALALPILIQYRQIQLLTLYAQLRADAAHVQLTNGRLRGCVLGALLLQPIRIVILLSIRLFIYQGENSTPLRAALDGAAGRRPTVRIRFIRDIKRAVFLAVHGELAVDRLNLAEEGGPGAHRLRAIIERRLFLQPTIG